MIASRRLARFASRVMSRGPLTIITAMCFAWWNRSRRGDSNPGMTTHWLQKWLRVLDSGVDEAAEVLTSRSPLALELRQNSPFAGALPQQTRSLVLAAFAKHWRDEHTAGHEGSGREQLASA